MLYKFVLLLSIFLSHCLYSMGGSAQNYIGNYKGSYTRDSCKISIDLNLKADGTYDLNIEAINTNTKANYHTGFYLIPLQTQGKWFVKKGVLFMAMKTTDTICEDGQTDYKSNFIFLQKYNPANKRLYRIQDKYNTKYLNTICNGFLTHQATETYTAYQFSRINNKLAIELELIADFYEQIWTGKNTFIVKE